jgi:hypothetical protein
MWSILFLPQQTKHPNMFFRQLQTECWVGNGTHYHFLHRPMYDYFHSYPICQQKVWVKITHLKIKKSCFFYQITSLVTFMVGSFSFLLSCPSLFIRSSSQLLHNIMLMLILSLHKIVTSIQLIYQAQIINKFY